MKSSTPTKTELHMQIAALTKTLHKVRDGLRSQAVGRMEWRVGKPDAYVISFEREFECDGWIADHKAYCEREGYQKIHARHLDNHESYMRATADFIDGALATNATENGANRDG